MLVVVVVVGVIYCSVILFYQSHFIVSFSSIHFNYFILLYFIYCMGGVEAELFVFSHDNNYPITVCQWGAV